MTQTHPIRWIEAADARRACEGALLERAMPEQSSMGMRLHSAFGTMQSSIQAFVADHHRGKVCESARSASDALVYFRSVLLD
jgi:hypothetical protein